MKLVNATFYKRDSEGNPTSEVLRTEVRVLNGDKLDRIGCGPATPITPGVVVGEHRDEQPKGAER